MIFKKWLLIIGSIFCTLPLYAQEQLSSPQVIEDIIEELAKGLDADADYSQLTDDLYYLLDNPINLNKATDASFEKLRVINDFQIKNLIDYRQTHGDLTTLYELQLIEGFDYATIKKMLPFVTLGNETNVNKWEVKKAVNYGKHSVISRVSSTIEPQAGFEHVADSVLAENPNNYYNGNRLHLYTRYKFSYKDNLQWGITAEKDPGEQFFNGAQSQGFDFYSAHLQISNVGIVKTALIGDYQVQFGQGLIMWSYLSTGKSSYIMDVCKRGKGINRYSSTDENVFLRGGAITLAKYGFAFTAFGSHKPIDANITMNDTLNDESQFSSFLNLGIHATPAQLADKDAIKETVYGANTTLQHKNFKVGVSGIQYQFNLPFQPAESAENQFRFSGKSNYNVSADAEVKFKALHIFTEAALSENRGKAFLAGALMELTPQIRASVLYRNYQKEYQALYSNAFAENSRVQNEQGFYTGIELCPVKKWKIAAYNDLYKFPWLTANTDAPSKGNDFLIQADYTMSRTVTMYWRYKHEVKEQNADSVGNGIAKLIENKKTFFRYQIAYLPFESWEFRNRVELSGFANEFSETGYFVYQDVIYRPASFPLSLTLRYALFDTESYKSRIYAYEADVLYASSVPALYETGSRFYLLLHYKATKGLDFWLRYSQTRYSDKTETGTGLNAIAGNTRSDIKFQVRWQF